jgi:hypothetical protein
MRMDGQKSLTQGLKPSLLRSGTARLKPCPDTKHQSRDYGNVRYPKPDLRGFSKCDRGGYPRISCAPLVAPAHFIGLSLMNHGCTGGAYRDWREQAAAIGLEGLKILPGMTCQK